MNEAIDLTNCEHEPITIPGCIQPHGLLLVLRAADLAVVQVSANTAHFLDIAPGETLGQPVGRWFNEASVCALAERRGRTIPARSIPCCSPGDSPRISAMMGSSTALDPTSSWN